MSVFFASNFSPVYASYANVNGEGTSYANKNGKDASYANMNGKVAFAMVTNQSTKCASMGLKRSKSLQCNCMIPFTVIKHLETCSQASLAWSKIQLR